MKAAGFVLGTLALVIGIIWMGQGSGYFPYPASSFMINETPWIYRGGLLALAGLILIIVLRTKSRRR
ncbi:MAG TPA: hypothetical protein VN229_14045 [Terriglobales bacterium]|nr:hypothetical protein [Terriglobales bacterium]